MATCVRVWRKQAVPTAQCRETVWRHRVAAKRLESWLDRVPRVGLTTAMHAVLGLLGLSLLAAGLGVLSGLGIAASPEQPPALVMVKPLPTLPTAPAEPPGARSTRSAGPHTPDGAAQAAAAALQHGSATNEPPQTSGRPLPADNTARHAPSRLAVVIDDIGYNMEMLEDLLALERPFTFAVLPDVPQARQSADLIRSAGREFIIHLPMQPLDYPDQNPGPRPLLLSQDLEFAEARLRSYLQLLPDAVGASNHMGSAYTGDERHMQRVQSVLHGEGRFFLNSRTSGTPVPEHIARAHGYSYLQRDVFLDHDPAERAIEQALGQALRQAKENGSAIAIGHPYPQTLRVLRRHLEGLQAAGVTLVPLSDLL